MTNLTNALEQLREEQRQAQEQAEKLQGAILVIAGLVGQNSRASARNNALPESISGGTEANVTRTEGKMGEPAQATAVNDEQKSLGGNTT
jgi:small-conductance mechanosensitive channel